MNEKSQIAARWSTKTDIVAERTLFKTMPVVYWQTNRQMAGHSKFSNIKHRKEAQDSKKSALMGQYVKLAQSAVKSKQRELFELYIELLIPVIKLLIYILKIHW